MRMAKTKTPIIQLVVMKMISVMFVGFLFFPAFISNKNCGGKGVVSKAYDDDIHNTHGII